MTSSTLIVGLGITGLSVARYLFARGQNFVIADSRVNPPGLLALQQHMPRVKVYTGPFDPVLFTRQDCIIASPGINPREPALQAAENSNIPIISDIELFARAAQSPYIAITGSNGKSTVTTLLGEMARHSGKRVAVGGNLGQAALDLITAPEADLYVLELSSFQLERVHHLRPIAATVLNISADHLDYHGSMEAYIAAKARILEHAECIVYNRDDPVSSRLGEGSRRISFGLTQPLYENDYGLRHTQNLTWLARGQENLLSLADMRLRGRHNMANALAALALGEAAGLARDAMLACLINFQGLAHRFQWVACVNDVNWYNDSKATNVGATLAALAGLPAPIVLIAGGQGKGQDFSPLCEIVAKTTKAVILLGEDAHLMAATLGDHAYIRIVKDMSAAVDLAAKLACPGDSVLLAPACASLDMYRNYEHRGEVFTAAVQYLKTSI